MLSPHSSRAHGPATLDGNPHSRGLWFAFGESKLLGAFRRKRRAACFAVGFALLLPIVVVGSALNFESTAGKVERTPGFWQQDKEAGFVDGGSNYCAPTAISNGLIYLAQTRGMPELAPGATHADQIALIKDLAADMDTDPKNGTNPDKILTGLRRYVQGKGLRMNRLEVATWRKLSAANRACWVGAKPNLEWMRQAAIDPDCVEVFNVGWYRQEEGGYSRHSGHWVTVFGAGPGTSDFAVRNPLLHPETQQMKTAVALTMLENDFKIVSPEGGDAGNMSGYFRVDGPGLPLGSKTAAAVLDSVIVFSLQK
jgi:hypothetical protein